MIEHNYRGQIYPIPRNIPAIQRDAFTISLAKKIKAQEEILFQNDPEMQRFYLNKRRCILISMAIILVILTLKALEPRFSPIPRTFVQLMLVIMYIFAGVMVPTCIIAYFIYPKIIKNRQIAILAERPLNISENERIMHRLFDETANELGVHIVPTPETTHEPPGGGFKKFSGTAYRLGDSG